MTLHQFDVDLPGGIRLACRSNRDRDELSRHAPVVLLHGFPEAAFAWDEVQTLLRDRVPCIAPNLRGFASSSAPADVQAYRPRHLVGDVVALIDAFGGRTPLLVAHDWGGALAWNLAAQRADKLQALLILNSPHPATFLRELRDSPAQQEASRYMNFLCRPDAAALLAEDDFRRMWTFFQDEQGERPRWLDEATAEQYRQVWRAGMEGGLNYYRASPLRPPTSPADPIHGLVLDDAMVNVRVPTQVLWGERDRALRPGLLDGLERWVPQLNVRRVPEASHWIVHEQPALVAGTIESMLSPSSSQTTT